MVNGWNVEMREFRGIFYNARLLRCRVVADWCPGCVVLGSVSADGVERGGVSGKR